MQTFLPYADYSQSMSVLDNVRLGNQVYREGNTLLNGGWKNHPAFKMWVGFERSLAHYCLRGAQEMCNRHGTKHSWSEDVCIRWITYFQDKINELPETGDPDWLGREDIHASHRSNLLRKDATYYSQFGWTEPHDLDYVWPV